MKTCSEGIEDFVRVSLVPTISAAFTLCISIGISNQLSEQLMFLITLEIFILIAGTLLFSFFYEKLAKDRIAMDSRFLAKLELDKSKAVAILFSGIRKIWRLGRLDDIRIVAISRRKVAQAESIYFAFVTFFLGTYICAGYFLLIEVHSLPKTTFVAFVFYSGLMMAPISRICSFVPEYKNYIALRKSLMLDHYKSSSKMSSPEFAEFYHRVFVTEFSNYSSKRILISGPSGSGKTTLLLKLIGFYPSKISCDGIDVSEAASVANDLGIYYLSEQPFFEPGKPIERFLVDAELLEACNSYFKLFPKDYLKAVLGKEISATGSPLSYGERQRLNLLATLAQRPKILLMDEALSGVDEKSEKNILSKIIDDRSIEVLLYVSHRSSIQSMFDIQLPVEKIANRF